MKAGELVSSSVIIGIIKEYLKKSEKNIFLIDGFPRNKENLKAWDEELSDLCDVKMLFWLYASYECMMRRQKERSEEYSQIEGYVFNEEVLRKRIQVCEEETKPIFYSFAKKVIVKEINADNDFWTIFDNVEKILKEEELI